MKNKAGLYFGLIIFLIAIGLGGFLLNSSLWAGNNARTTTKTEYKMPQKEVLKLKDVPELMEHGYTGILYIGYESCPYCQEVKPLVYEAKSNYPVNFKYIKLKNKNNDRLFTDEDKGNVYKYFHKYMDKNDDGTYSIYSPLVVAVKNGQVLNMHLSTVDGHDASVAKMTDKQRTLVQACINELFAEVLS